jgi:hypothetical protein
VSGSLLQLDYARRPAWHRRRALRWIAVGVVLVVVAGSGWRWGPEKWKRAELLYWQWRCLRYTAPAD